MKKVLITGGAGFISHHLIYYLIKNTNWNIVSLDRLDYSGNLNRLDHILSEFSGEEKSRLKVVFHDLKSEINPWIKKELGDIDIILHLAAGSHVDRSIDYPMEFVLDNVVGTANILEYARFINSSKIEPTLNIPNSNKINIFIDEQRRIFNEEIHYFDHPMFGLIISIKEI